MKKCFIKINFLFSICILISVCPQIIFSQNVSVSLGYTNIPLIISGFKDAYLTDYVVATNTTAGMGDATAAERETVFNNYSSSNVSGFSAIYVAMDYKIGPEKEYSVLLDYAQAFGGGDNTLNAFSIGGGYTFMDLIKNYDLQTFGKYYTVRYYSDMGKLPYYNGQINVPEGDFNTGDSMQLNISGGATSIGVKSAYELNPSSGVDFGLEYITGDLGKPVIKIKDVEIKTSNTHASTCSGESSVSLSCSDFFNPFENASAKLNGFKIFTAYQYKF